MDNLNKLILKAKELFYENQFNEVIALFSDEILITHEDSNLYCWVAYSYYKLDDYERAFLYSNKAIIADPNNYLGYRIRGTAWFGKNEVDKSLADYNKSISLNTNDYLSYVNRAIILSKNGELENAISDCTKAIGIDSNDFKAYHIRGGIWLDKNEFDKAINDYTKALSINNNLYSTYNNRAIAHGRKGNLNKAIEDYNNAISIKQDFALAYSNRGLTFYDIGEFQKAIEDFNMAMKINDKYIHLEDNIRLAKEKLGDREILNESGAEQNDKTERIKIEKEIETLINKVRELSKSNVKTVVHYTKISVAELYVISNRIKMHYSNAIYMNDPMEGKVFFDYLESKEIELAYLNGEKRTETSVYLGSFLPAEENNGEISHEDELVMWRTYGKDENGKEAAGASVVISSDFFKMKTHSNEPSLLQDTYEELRNSEELLNVIYVKNLRDRKEIANESKEKIEITLKKLKQQLIKFLRLRNKYNKKDDFYKEIDNTIFKQLSTITYLFKSADYDFEHEVRVITYIPRDSESIKSRSMTELNAPPKKFYIESYNDILPFVKKIFLGPKVENYQQWSLYFDYEIRQRAKELSKITDFPYKIKPSDIEIMKSECKFQ